MKSILLHVESDPGLESRLQAALDLVRTAGGHLTCVHATSPKAYVAYSNFGGVFVIADVIKAVDEHRKQLRADIEARMSREDVSWDFKELDADVWSALVSEGYLNDLIIMSHPAKSADRAVANSNIGDVLMHARIPVLVMPENASGFDPRGVAMIAWNGSYEAAHALRLSLPMLAQASAVHLVTVTEEKEVAFPSTAASQYLSRHGISSELHVFEAIDNSVEEEIEFRANELGASYLVLGAYSRSRVREYVFGGVTRHMLYECSLPLLLTH